MSSNSHIILNLNYTSIYFKNNVVNFIIWALILYNQKGAFVKN